MPVAIQRPEILTRPSGETDIYFGRSVAVSSNGLVMAVGNGINASKIYIYDKVGESWVYRGAVTQANSYYSGQFGMAVALSADGSVLAVGAPYNSSAMGTVTVYDWNGSAWAQRSAFTGGDTASSDYYGYSVALADNGAVLFVGSWLWEGANTNQGGVYVYDWNGTVWTQRGAVLTPSDASSFSGFGGSIAATPDGLKIVVGAPSRSGAVSSSGGVYTFEWVAGAWSQIGSAVASPSPQTDYNFGSGVALNSAATVMAVGEREEAGVYRGRVYLYEFVAGAWELYGTAVTPDDAADFDSFGAVSLSANGDVLYVGAYKWEGATADMGAVYTFDIPAFAPGVVLFWRNFSGQYEV